MHRRRRKRLYGQAPRRGPAAVAGPGLDAALGPMVSDSVEEIEIQLLLEALYQRYHYDFRQYARASIKRRLKQARQQMGFSSFTALQDSLLHDPAMLARLLDYLTVQVSEMF